MSNTTPTDPPADDDAPDVPLPTPPKPKPGTTPFIPTNRR